MAEFQKTAAKKAIFHEVHLYQLIMEEDYCVQLGILNLLDCN